MTHAQPISVPRRPAFLRVVGITALGRRVKRLAIWTPPDATGMVFYRVLRPWPEAVYITLWVERQVPARCHIGPLPPRREPYRFD